MAGKHEPESKGSFYLSLTTAALRAGLVVAAVVLGIFVLSRAFPTADEGSPPGAPGPIATGTAGAPDDGESPPPEEESPPEEEVTLQGVSVQVQNGTTTTGLAAETAERLKEEGLRIREIGNADRTFEMTTLFFAQGSRPEAEELRDTFFEGEAEIERMPADMEQEVQLVVVLGLDYAKAQG